MRRPTMFVSAPLSRPAATPIQGASPARQKNREVGLCLSVIIPVYNEKDTLEEIVRRVRATKLTINKAGTNPLLDGPITLACEIIVVDDGSTDGTREILDKWRAEDADDMRILYHARNGGKGAALRTGFAHASGDIIVIQDADLEYDPQDYVHLIEPILEGCSPVVYGSRFLGGPRAAMSLTHTLGNKFLTIFTNLLFGTSLSDMETCYKCMRREVIADMPLHSRRFEIEPELTVKILKRGYTIFEVPIRYNGRDFHAGKKISWRDGFSTIGTLIKYRLIE